MTTPDTFGKTSQLEGRFRPPDTPEREPDEKMTSAEHLYEPGNTHHVAQHFGNPDSKLVAAERYIVGVGWYKTVGSPRATAWLAICGTDSPYTPSTTSGCLRATVVSLQDYLTGLQTGTSAIPLLNRSPQSGDDKIHKALARNLWWCNAYGHIL